MYPSNVDYLNLEYFLAKAYDFVVGFHWSAGVAAAPSWTITAVTTIVIIGMSASLLLLLMIVYAQIRLLQVEHGGFHALEHAAVHEHEVHKHEATEEAHAQNERWRRIEELSASTNHGDWRRAILEADIMLGDALNQAGYVGPTIGDQLKMTNPLQLTTLDLAWRAHKVRNDIAHGGEAYELTQRDAQAAINNFRRVFEELGAI